MKKTSLNKVQISNISSLGSFNVCLDAPSIDFLADYSVVKVSYAKNLPLASAVIKPSDENADHNWQEFLEGVEFSEKSLVEGVETFSEAVPEGLLDSRCKSMFVKVKESIEVYLSEMDADSKKKYPSQESLFQLFRYLYEIPSDSDFYIDSDNGFFGFSLKRGRERLSISLKDNKEVIYSVVSPGAGISKFSGRGFMAKNKDSKKIRKIIRMMDGG